MVCGTNAGMSVIKWFARPSYESNIPKFYVYQALYNCMLFLPVWVIFLQEKHDLSLTQVTLLDSAFWLTMVITEIPTGVVADTLGRKNSQLIGMILSIVALLLFGYAPNYSVLIMANSFWAFAITFISGADIAFFYDTLKESGRESEYSKYRGWLSAVRMLSIAISGLLGGFIGSYDLRATFSITALMLLFGTLFLLWLKEPQLEDDPETGSKTNYRQTLKVVLGSIRQNTGLRYALVYSSLFFLMPAAIRVTFFQPYAVDIGLPISSLGVIALVFRAFQVLGSVSAGKMVQRMGEWKLLTLSPVPIFLGLLALGSIQSWFGIALFAATGFITMAATPTIENVIIRQTPGTVRATILSIDSLIFRLLTAVLSPFVGLTADIYGLPIAFIGMSLVFGVLMLLLIIFWQHLHLRTSNSTAMRP
jgi:MFS family permease